MSFFYWYIYIYTFKTTKEEPTAANFSHSPKEPNLLSLSIILQKPNLTISLPFYFFSRSQSHVPFNSTYPCHASNNINCCFPNFFSSYFTVTLRFQKFNLAGSKHGVIASIIKNPYLTNYVCNLKRIYIVLLTNFTE